MKQRLLFLGPPGAGKGTQAVSICNGLGLAHLSTGDLLRSEVEAGTNLGQEAGLLMSKGELVSDELVLSIVQNKLSSIELGWVLDGFPRNVVQAKSLETLLNKLNQNIEAVFLIDVQDEILIKRLLARGRSDDNEEVIRYRLEVYRDRTAPLVDYYKQQNLVHVINGDGDVKLISGRIKEFLN